MFVSRNNGFKNRERSAFSKLCDKIRNLYDFYLPIFFQFEQVTVARNDAGGGSRDRTGDNRVIVWIAYHDRSNWAGLHHGSECCETVDQVPRLQLCFCQSLDEFSSLQHIFQFSQQSATGK